MKEEDIIAFTHNKNFILLINLFFIKNKKNSYTEIAKSLDINCSFQTKYIFLKKMEKIEVVRTVNKTRKDKGCRKKLYYIDREKLKKIIFSDEMVKKIKIIIEEDSIIIF